MRIKILAGIAALAFSFALAASPATGEELRCLDGTIRTEVETGRFEETRASYCTDRAGLKFVEKKCQNALNDCIRRVLKAAPAPTPGEPRARSEFGSPGFRRCAELGGEGRFVEIDAISGRTRAAICFFKEPGTFLDHDTLFGLTPAPRAR